MNSRERVITTLSHKEPDKVPVDLGGYHSSITYTAYDKLIKYLQLDLSPKIYDKIQGITEPDRELMERFGVDIIHIQLNPPKKSKIKKLSENSFIDEFGIKWQKPPSSYYYDMIEHPLVNVGIDELNNYKFPDINDLFTVEGLKEKARDYYENTDYAITADPRLPGLFEFGWWLRGLEKFCIDLVNNTEFVEVLLDKTVRLYKEVYEKYLEEVGDYVQIVEIGGDYGMQNGLIMAPKIFRELFKPRMREYVQFIKNKAKNVKIQFHCCGSITSIISDLIEVGVDILNPVQVAAANMDSAKLKKKFGSRICFLGAIDTQEILPHGAPSDVKEEVKRRIRDLAPGGGYVLSSVHNIQPEVPPENIVAMYESAKKYGKYPILL